MWNEPENPRGCLKGGQILEPADIWDSSQLWLMASHQQELLPHLHGHGGEHRLQCTP